MLSFLSHIVVILVQILSCAHYPLTTVVFVGTTKELVDPGIGTRLALVYFRAALGLLWSTLAHYGLSGLSCQPRIAGILYHTSHTSLQQELKVASVGTSYSKSALAGNSSVAEYPAGKVSGLLSAFVPPDGCKEAAVKKITWFNKRPSCYESQPLD